MAQSTTVAELSKLIKELRAERQQHVDAIGRIDQTFEQFGISADKDSLSVSTTSTAGKKTRKSKKSSSGKKKTSAKKSGGKKRRGPNTYAITGEESILGFVSQHGEANSKDINTHWSGEGRGGKANNTLTKLVKDKKLKRVKKKNERGSRYKLA